MTQENRISAYSIVYNLVIISVFALQVLLPQLEALNADLTVLSADTDAEKRKQDASSREVADLKDRLQQVFLIPTPPHPPQSGVCRQSLSSSRILPLIIPPTRPTAAVCLTIMPHTICGLVTHVCIMVVFLHQKAQDCHLLGGHAMSLPLHRG